ncbi:uncharacterized serine-rich protein C215.13-like [Teleopsis dalmanni]|uniref:uncharacterized serine-rich protein C215.13-like n=1 Tax=Teleopsis dalmanni TaxID=139649 RepID=UPI0018CD0747|nr:uncharacterized serine-rich protein C215.13-like [Teleopsis dalmanni]
MVMLLRYRQFLKTKSLTGPATISANYRTAPTFIIFLLLSCVGGGSSGSHAHTSKNAFSMSGNSGGSSGRMSRATLNNINSQKYNNINIRTAALTLAASNEVAIYPNDSNRNMGNLYTSAALTASSSLSLTSAGTSGAAVAASLTSASVPSLSLTGSSALNGASSSSSSASASASATSNSASSSTRNSRQNSNYNNNNNNQIDQLPPQLSSRIIHTRNGAISGVIVQLDGRHLDPVEAYRGIPYASPPVGNLRFMPPVSAAMWSGVKKADRFSPVCPQRLPDIANETAALERMPKGRLEYLKRLLPYLQNQSEDCLYLNIYVPIQDIAHIVVQMLGEHEKGH